MAKREKTIPFRIFIKDTATGETSKWDELIEEQKNGYKARMSENLSKRMSQYYSENLNEFERLGD
jgi:hypothetical protein